MTIKSVLFGARRGTRLGARGVAGLASSKSVDSGNLNLNKTGLRPMPVTIRSVRNSIGRLPLGRGFIPFAILLAWFALSPPARAVNPPPVGGYPGGNTATGSSALFGLTTGTGNTALGFTALFANTTGSANAATGSGALSSNTTGNNNTATGADALERNTTGSSNTANGQGALLSNTTGNNNTANGGNALTGNTTGTGNTALVLPRSLLTQPVAATRPPVLVRSGSTQPASEIRPTVLMRSRATQPAAQASCASWRGLAPG